MDKLKDAQVIVVGAGIAGLTAAWKLKQFGIDVLVLEAEQEVGGRMRSIQLEDALIDYGAQFLSSAYTVIPNLIKEVGLKDQFVPTSEWVGFVKKNHITLINPRKPWHLISKKILSLFDFLRLSVKQFRLFNRKKNLGSLNDITSWISYDNQSANKWIIQNFGETVAHELTSTILNGFYFQNLETSSASLIAAVLAFSAYKPRTMTLKDGIGALANKLAEQLNIRTNTSVSAILEEAGGVKIIAKTGEFKAEHVIVTVPAPIAKNIISYPDKTMSALFSTPYSSSVVISLLIDHWEPPSSIEKGYGFLFNPLPNNKIAALTIENNKCFTRKKRGYLINVMLADECAKKLLHLKDEIIIDEIKSDIEIILPDVYQHIHAMKIFRWPYAMPCTPIGRARTVKDYHDTRDQNNRIWLAGDYLGFPWTDSAAETGIRAANQIISIYALHNDNLSKETIQWGLQYLSSNGYTLKSTLPEMVQNTPWSFVVRFVTSNGYIYLKQTPKLIALEASIIQILCDRFHAHVPKIIAHNTELNCFLMEDAGKSLRSILKQKFDEKLLFKAIDQFTSLQLAIVDHEDVFLEIGVPDWRLDKLPDLYKQLLSQKDMLIADGLSEKEIKELETLIPTVTNLCKKLSGYAIKETIVQPDFNDNNTLINDTSQEMTIIDLGEIAISHPFFSLINFLYVIKKHYALTDEDDTYQRIKNSCLKKFLNFEPNTLDAFKLAGVLFFIYGALCSYRLMMACDKVKFTAHFQRHGRPGDPLKKFIASLQVQFLKD